jgi:hypothetical protein
VLAQGTAEIERQRRQLAQEIERSS